MEAKLKFQHSPESLAKIRASQVARKAKNAAFKELRKQEKLARQPKVPAEVTPAVSVGVTPAAHPAEASISLANQTDAVALESAAIARIIERIRAARTDVCEFVEFCMRTPSGVPLKLAPFQREWLLAMVQERRLLVEASRFHGKTTLTIAFCLWMLGNNPNLRIKFFCQNDKRAKERLFELRQNIEKNPAVRLVFPNLKQAENGEWTKTKLVVERSADIKDASFEAIGITSSVTGGRADLVVCDDVCDLRTSVLYPSFRDQIIQKFKGEMLPMLDPGHGKIIYIATPWHRADLTAVLQQSAEWRRLRYAVGNDEDRTLPIWPEQWPRVELERMLREQGSIEYDRAFRCISYSADSIICKPEWIKYYTKDLLGNPLHLICLQAYDLAISQTSDADYFAGVTVLYDPERNIAFVADFFQTRCSFSEQGNIIIRNFLRWEADRVWIEAVGLGGGLYSYLEENGPKNLPLNAYKPKGDKQRRLMEVTPWLEGGKVYFHPHMDPQRNVLDMDTGDIISQLLEFPIAKHDDLVDALVTALFGLFEFKVKENESGWADGEGIRARVSVME